MSVLAGSIAAAPPQKAQPLAIILNVMVGISVSTLLPASCCSASALSGSASGSASFLSGDRRILAASAGF
jgi:hypothetical protein